VKTSILFWNVGGNAPTAELRALIEAERPEIVILAESPTSPAKLLETLNSPNAPQYHLPLNYSNRLKFLVALPAGSFGIVSDSGGVSVRRVSPIATLPFLLVAVHLPSKLFMERADQSQLTGRLARIVVEAEQHAGHARTIVIGDLNMNPFEDGIVGSEGLHAVATRTIASKGSRVVAGERRPFFYNPMCRT
jgi:Endonuclease/Exonuclease/phosphatase family